MTSDDWLAAAIAVLPGDTPELDARLLLAHVTQLSLTQQRIHQVVLTEKQYQDLQALRLRREHGEPIAYLLGHQPFYTLDLRVNEHTLIPRPDSEQLVDVALEKMRSMVKPCVADLGTGSGALALAVADARSDAIVLATDRSIPALHIARQNAVHNKINNVYFIATDWLTGIQDHCLDIIISNPPYIAEDDPHLSNLCYEPLSALTAKENGYHDLYYLIEHAPRVLKDKGWLMLEHGYTQAETLRQYARQRNWQNVATVQDYGGNDRVTIMQYHAD